MIEYLMLLVEQSENIRRFLVQFSSSFAIVIGFLAKYIEHYLNPFHLPISTFSCVRNLVRNVLVSNFSVLPSLVFLIHFHFWQNFSLENISTNKTCSFDHLFSLLFRHFFFLLFFVFCIILCFSTFYKFGAILVNRQIYVRSKSIEQHQHRNIKSKPI